MRAYADTSFLASLYLRDGKMPQARAYLIRRRGALRFTSLQRYELRNAIRLAVFRGFIGAAEGENAMSEISRDASLGKLHETDLVWPEVLHVADEIGAKHTALLGARSLDLLHVGAAVSMGTQEFLTLDVRQRALAEAAGMRVLP